MGMKVCLTAPSSGWTENSLSVEKTSKGMIDWWLPRGFPGDSVVKNPPAKQETRVHSLGQEDPLEKERATHSSILARKIAWTEEPGGLQSMGSQESDTTERLKTAKEWLGATRKHASRFASALTF